VLDSSQRRLPQLPLAESEADFASYNK
jgi:hypothetical protein